MAISVSLRRYVMKLLHEESEQLMARNIPLHEKVNQLLPYTKTFVGGQSQLSSFKLLKLKEFLNTPLNKGGMKYGATGQDVNCLRGIVRSLVIQFLLETPKIKPYWKSKVNQSELKEREELKKSLEDECEALNKRINAYLGERAPELSSGQSLVGQIIVRLLPRIPTRFMLEMCIWVVLMSLYILGVFLRAPIQHGIFDVSTTTQNAASIFNSLKQLFACIMGFGVYSFFQNMVSNRRVPTRNIGVFELLLDWLIPLNALMLIFMLSLTQAIDMNFVSPHRTFSLETLNLFTIFIAVTFVGDAFLARYIRSHRIREHLRERQQQSSQTASSLDARNNSSPAVIIDLNNVSGEQLNQVINRRRGRNNHPPRGRRPGYRR